MQWIIANLANIVIGAVLLGLAALAVRKLIKDKKKGVGCGSCEGCGGSCHK